MKIKLIHGDCLKELAHLPDNSIDSVVTDPPYGLKFMGKKWDCSVPSVDIWKQVLRVLKPGGHLLCFAGTRTQHRMACNIEDAGFEIRDMIAWIYGSGFPKSLNISKAIDKNNVFPESAKRWDGWGTALKPALEPITMARKPLLEKTVAYNVLKWGTGGINIDDCRVGSGPRTLKGNTPDMRSGKYNTGTLPRIKLKEKKVIGRWPANLIHDGGWEQLELFPYSKSSGGDGYKNSIFVGGKQTGGHGLGDTGSASRFFYCAKASKKDRDEGLQGELKSCKNNHPTVKPTKLMRYLVRLVTPVNGTALDPFMGSGSTGKACRLEGFNFIGIEMDEDYMAIAKARSSPSENISNK